LVGSLYASYTERVATVACNVISCGYIILNPRNLHSRPYSTPNIENPDQNEAQDSKVIESAAKVVLANALPFVPSVQQPWNAQLPMVCLICGPLVALAAGAVVAPPVAVLVWVAE
jgi:hypothetical protein